MTHVDKKQKHPKTAMVIVAHPDDAEFLCGGTVAKLVQSGWKVYYMLTTSGDMGSKTMALHVQIYAAASQYDQKTSCVIHTHSTHCVALTLTAPDAELLPALTPYFVMKVGHVPVIPYRRPGVPEAAELVAQTIRRYGDAGTPIRAVMLERLGPNVWHDSPAAAMATLEELEETARLMLLNPSASDALTEKQIDELRRTFGARW